MVLLLSDLDGLVPFVEFLVHGHGILNLIVLDEQGLSLVELLLQNGEFGLNSEVFDTILFGHAELVELSQVISLGDVTKSSKASLSNLQVLLLDQRE